MPQKKVGTHGKHTHGTTTPRTFSCHCQYERYSVELKRSISIEMHPPFWCVGFVMQRKRESHQPEPCATTIFTIPQHPHTAVDVLYCNRNERIPAPCVLASAFPSCSIVPNSNNFNPLCVCDDDDDDDDYDYDYSL